MKKFAYVLVGIILATTLSVWASRITDYDPLAEIPATGDYFAIVDVSDTTMAASGTTKKLEYQYIINSNLATLRSPTANRLFYSNGSSVITEVPLGTAYQIWMMNSGGTAPEPSSTLQMDGIRTSVTWQDATTPTKEGQHDLSNVTAGQTRVMTWPDSNFTVPAIPVGKNVDHDIWQAVYIDAAAMIPDGTICLAAAEQTLNSGPNTYVIDCSSDAAGTFEFKIGMPENWDGGSIIIEPILISDEATPAGTIEWDASIQARGNDELVNTTYVTTNGEIYFEDAETANTTVDTQWDLFRCKNKTAMAAAGAGGDNLFVLLTRDNDDATHDTSTQGVWILGAKVFFQIDDMDEKD